jgi:hypothetical protein
VRLDHVDTVRGVIRYELRHSTECEFVAWPEVGDRAVATPHMVRSRADLAALQQSGNVVTLDEVTQAQFDDCFPEPT